VSERSWFIAGFISGIGACGIITVIVVEIMLYRAVQ
jgi:hypothetical protein